MSQENQRRVGRPKGINAYGESTKPVRIPISKIDDVLLYIKNKLPTVEIPLYANKVSAGFPSPADDYIECKLDLNTHLIKHPAATFLLKVSGDSMQNASIHSGDMLIVDKSIDACDGKIVIAAINGELTVKRLRKTKTKTQLVPENPDYPVIDITEEQDVVIWGVVVHVIHQVS